MIVRRSGSTLLLITQPDHAALAGRIMRRWTRGLLQEPVRRDDILLAVDQHDNGWQEVDQAPIVDESSGRILDFVHAPDVVRQGVWPRGVERLASRPYAAALVAQHANHVYRSYRSRPEWTGFFADMESRRDRHLGRVPAGLDELLRDYVAVRIGDLISLAFCTGSNEMQGEGSYSIRLDGTRVLVTPDPFAGRTVPIAIDAIELPDRPFSSAADAQRAMTAGARRSLAGEVLGGD